MIYYIILRKLPRVRRTNVREYRSLATFSFRLPDVEWGRMKAAYVDIILETVWRGMKPSHANATSESTLVPLSPFLLLATVSSSVFRFISLLLPSSFLLLLFIYVCYKMSLLPLQRCRTSLCFEHVALLPLLHKGVCVCVPPLLLFFFFFFALKTGNVAKRSGRLEKKKKCCKSSAGRLRTTITRAKRGA